MKKIVIMLLVLVAFVFCFQTFKEDNSTTIHNEQLSQSFLSKHIPIVDIRTKKEWEATGVVKDSILLTFYKSDKTFDADNFLNTLNKNFDKKSEFAILCRSGNRSNRVTRFLMSKGYTHVINLAGGVKQGIKNNVQLIKY